MSRQFTVSVMLAEPPIGDQALLHMDVVEADRMGLHPVPDHRVAWCCPGEVMGGVWSGGCGWFGGEVWLSMSGVWEMSINCEICSKTKDKRSCGWKCQKNSAERQMVKGYPQWVKIEGRLRHTGESFESWPKRDQKCQKNGQKRSPPKMAKSIKVDKMAKSAPKKLKMVTVCKEHLWILFGHLGPHALVMTPLGGDKHWLF